MHLERHPLSPAVVRFAVPGVDRRGLLTALRDDPAAGAALTAAIVGTGFPAACLELPPISAASASRPAELVVVESPALARAVADPSPFAGPFAAGVGDVVVFENLGRDAVLVAPRPRVAPGATHLVVFLRTAAAPVVGVFWRTVGEAVSARIGAAPLWVSTAGLGVSWLHLRLDRTPKYYRHEPYRDRQA